MVRVRRNVDANITPLSLGWNVYLVGSWMEKHTEKVHTSRTIVAHKHKALPRIAFSLSCKY